MINLFQTRLFKKVASKFGFYYNSIRIHGVKFDDVGTSDLKEYYFNKNVEIETYKFLKGSNYETFIDIGAYFGFFSIYAKLKVGIKNVIAYEASQKNFNQLKKFAKLNNADFEIINKAVGDKRGNVKFYNPIYKGTSSFTQHGQIDGPKTNPIYADKKYETTDIEMLPIKDIIDHKVNGSTLIKIDIEGYEEKTLRTIKDYLKNVDHVDFLIEFLINDKNNDSLFNYLTSLGYNAYLLTNAGLIYEERPLTLPKPYRDSSVGYLSTLWKDHLFTKKDKNTISQLNKIIYKYNL